MLTKREKRILSLVSLSTKQIAKKLNISPKTVELHFTHMFEKYGVNSRIKLLFEAVKTGDLKVIDCGFWNPYGQYIEDLRIVDLKKG